MAPKQKRPSPLDDPPSASSSDSESADQEPQFVMHRQQHQQHHQEEEESSSEEEEENEDEDEEEEEEPVQPSQPPSNSHPKPSSDSETETDSEPEPDTPLPNSKVKPLASMPMDQTPKTKSKPNPSPSASAPPSKSASKRPAEANGHAGDSKRSKKKAAAAASSEETEEDRKKPVDDDSKKSQRVFSADDEIAILKGLVEFSTKTGTDPFKNTDAFHDFVKKSLRRDTTSNQLKEKIRRLKKKYETNGKGGKNGEGPSFSKPHEQKAFELAKKIWGNTAAAAATAEVATSNGVVAEKENSGKANGKVRKTPKKENVPKHEPKPEAEVEPMDLDEPGSGKFDAPLALRGFVRFSELSEDVVKERMEWIEASKRQELENKWSEILEAEFDLRAQRAELIAEQAKLISKGRRASKN